MCLRTWSLSEISQCDIHSGSACSVPSSSVTVQAPARTESSDAPRNGLASPIAVSALGLADPDTHSGVRRGPDDGLPGSSLVSPDPHAFRRVNRAVWSDPADERRRWGAEWCGGLR